LLRRRTDLLDVFRAPAPAPRRGDARSPKSVRRVRLALGGTVAVLLVCLAFTAGRGLKAGRTAPAPRPLAAFRSGEWAIRAEVPRISPASARDLATAIPRALPERFPDLRGRLRVGAGPTKATIRVIVSGFRSKAEADRALERLVTFGVESSFPFRWATVVQVE
jgi:hypothetical protein